MLLHRRRRRVGRPRKQYGGSIFGSINDFLKKHRLISTVGNALGSVGVPYAGLVGKAAGVLGYGKRRHYRRIHHRRVHLHRHRYGYGLSRVHHRRRRIRGGDLKSILSSAHKFVKDKHLISSALKHFGHTKFAAAASKLGYGRQQSRRRRVYRHRRVGGSLASIASAAHKFIKDKRLLSSAARFCTF
jgi:hypothetical protein